ncbi:leucine rich repeat [Chlorella sorokiniana]|uniref:Leucine rich repeat n=1 Tax=Chlorella sorokiniana TaxID=3076 RepID=A0A2P6TMA6_CHLSO|nr:leucine rich repeat [Chlorella sorokiniana]|eukprot:PRW45435.1 leucine rich repeat [Chlorella sorokiniana]
MPEAALSNPESLPPSLTALALNPVPVRPDGTGAIPPQILHMPFLQRLELLEGEGLHGLEESLQQLTQLTYLSLTDTHLDHLPPSMSALCNLRQLHLFNPNHAQAQEPDLSFLSVLARLQMLDVSLHSGMQQAPPQLAQLTNLVVLHLEETPLEALPGSLSSLVHLQVLGAAYTAVPVAACFGQD